ncbi:MAG: polysaccharide deacetylase family protein [Candidatus Rokubacteria bacterium]|nr:polysaccharide deacetylase family protein [Candidatus Rokubacteria bacterium]
MSALRSRPRSGLRVLLYHSIGEPGSSDSHGASVAPGRFAEQVAWLLDSGMPTVSLEDGLRANDLNPAVASVTITVDDGYLDALTVAAPLLARHRIPFTVFVIGAFVTAPPLTGRYLDAVALRELAAVPGATIGAHGHRHRPLTRLADGDVMEELTASRASISDILGRPPEVMSYPHGAVNARIVRHVDRAGFRLAATSLIGVNAGGAVPLRLRRTEVTARDDARAFAGKIRGDYDWYALKQRLYCPVPRLASPTR